MVPPLRKADDYKLTRPEHITTSCRNCGVIHILFGNILVYNQMHSRVYSFNKNIVVNHFNPIWITNALDYAQINW